MFYDVIEKIMDSKDVTVGGGSASAVAGAMAAGLVGMCVRLSTGKEYGFTDEKYLALADELDGYVKTLKDGAVEDTQAYLGIKSAFGLPKATDEEKAARRAAIEEAAVKAATVPLNNGRTALRIYNICKELEGNYNTCCNTYIILCISRTGKELRGIFDNYIRCFNCHLYRPHINIKRKRGNTRPLVLGFHKNQLRIAIHSQGWKLIKVWVRSHPVRT